MVGYRGGGGRTLESHGVSLCQAQMVAGSMRTGTLYVQHDEIL